MASWNSSILTGSSHAFAALLLQKAAEFYHLAWKRDHNVFPLGCLRTRFYFPVVKPWNLSRTSSSSGIIKKLFFSWRKLELLCNPSGGEHLPSAQMLELFTWLKLRSCLVLCCVCPARFCLLWLIGSLLNSHYKPESQKNFVPELFSGSPEVLRPTGKERGKSCLDCSFSWSEYFGFPSLRYMKIEAADKVCILFSCLSVWTRI